MKLKSPFGLITCLLTFGLASGRATAQPSDSELTPAFLSSPRSFYEQNVDLREENVSRIQNHLSFMVAYLRAGDTSHLTVTQKRNRTQLVGRLDDYWQAGVFPRNRTHPGLIPVFIDDGGRACAVADLMIYSGAGDLAACIAEEQNNAYLPDIDVPGAREWIESSGLSPEECVMIQPAYPCPGTLVDLTCSSQGDDIVLRWEVLTDTFEWIWIERSGIVVAYDLPPDTEEFVDVDIPPGDYHYVVRGESTFTCLDSDECIIQHNNWQFTRGDANGNGSFDGVPDLLFILNYSFLGGPTPPCMEAADINGDGVLLPIVDALHGLYYQFYDGAPPPAPFPDCGPPSEIAMGCAQPDPVCNP